MISAPLKSMPRLFRTLLSKRGLVSIAIAGCSVSAEAAPAPVVGEPARLIRRETLLLDGKPFAQASKGQEFAVLKRDAATAQVAYMKEDGSTLALTIPADALEVVPPAPWEDLLMGVRAFRDQRYDAARVLMARAVKDKEIQPFANALAVRISAATNAALHGGNAGAAGKQALTNTVRVLRDTADQLARAGRVSLAAAMDEGAERLGAPILGSALPPSQVNRVDLVARAATAERAFLRARQAIGAKRLLEARKLTDEGLAAEPAHPGLKTFQPLIKRGIEDADELYETANKMKRFEKGAVHALSAIDDGLKICSDHPRLRTLRGEMSAQFEERTSPPVTSAFVMTSKVTTAREHLEEGRRLYTNRCAECHDLEMLDSRSIGGWERMVSGMARRANLTATEKERVMEYLTAALKVVEAAP
jgi:hypothetical protein